MPISVDGTMISIHFVYLMALERGAYSMDFLPTNIPAAAYKPTTACSKPTTACSKPSPALGNCLQTTKPYPAFNPSKGMYEDPQTNVDFIFTRREIESIYPLYMYLVS